MNNDIKMEIENYVLRELEYLKRLDRKQDEYEKVTNNGIKNINTLVELLQKEDVNEDNLDLESKKIKYAEIKNNSDIDLKLKELKMNAEKDVDLKCDRILNVILKLTEVGVPIIFYNVWMNKGFKFEETGTYTSNTFKNLFSRFKPTGK